MMHHDLGVTWLVSVRLDTLDERFSVHLEHEAVIVLP